MATDIVPTLFGLTPEMYQRQQDALIDKQALQFAQLDPFERASYGIFRGASQLGGALGRALGGQDPELARISLRQSVAREIDYTDPASVQAGIQKLAPLDPLGAMMLTQEYRKAQESGALVGQREASAAASLAQASRERKQAIPADILKAEEIKRLTQQRNALLEMGDDQSAQQAALLKTQIDELRSLREVNGVLVDASGNPVYRGPPKEPALTEISRLINERDALIKSGRPVTDKDVRSIQNQIDKLGTVTPGPQVNVNAYTPASVEAQKEYIKTVADERKALRNAPDTIKNIDAAKKLIPTASTFMGKGGEPLLAAASFLNNRLGFNISTQGVTDATVLRTRLFEGILDNLKKLDSQPSQEQQRVLSEALGNLGTDPNALIQILNRIGETVQDRVDRYNTDVTESENRGVKFPFKPQIALPTRLTVDAAAQPPAPATTPGMPAGFRRVPSKGQP